MDPSDFYSYQFNERLQKSYEEVRKVINDEKVGQIVLLEKVNHQYSDKFFVAEQITRSMGNSVLLFLKTIGLKTEDLETIVKRSKDEAVTLSFVSSTTSNFTKEVEKKEKILEIYGFSISSFSSFKILYEYKVDINYNFNIYFGSKSINNDPSDVIQLDQYSQSFTTYTTGKFDPVQPSQKNPTEVNLTWLFRNLKLDKDNINSYAYNFNINRNNPKCLTPYRNPDIANINREIFNFSAFTKETFNLIKTQATYLKNLNEKRKSFDLDSLLAETTNALATVLPVLIKKKTICAPIEDNSSSSSTQEVIPSSPQNLTIVEEKSSVFTEEELKLLENHLASSLEESILRGNKIVQKIGGNIRSIVFSTTLTEAFQESLQYIEDLLRHQIVKAISRHLTTSDFNEYMNFHYRKIFNSKLAPIGFNYSVRRSENFSPEGYARIYAENDSTKSSLNTFTVDLPHETSMKFAISDNAKITFTGPKYVHGILFNSFSDTYANTLILDLEARQFSSFIVLLGNMVTSTEISIKHAVFLKNKDSLQIPLLLESIPSQKQFLDFISSLSPEQQEFAKAYRQMQLETSLFGMVLIQVRPQLEKVLNLPPASLVKEIQLNDDLVNLFTKYQINSDLLAFEEDYQVPSNKDKIQAVKNNVDNINRIIEQAKDRDLKEKEYEKKYQKEADFTLQYSEMSRTRSAPKMKKSSMSLFRNSAPQGEYEEESISYGKADIALASGPAPSIESASDGGDDDGDMILEEEVIESNEETTVTETKQEVSKIDDLISLPKRLDDAFYKYSSEENVLSTTIKVSPNRSWTKVSFKSILAPSTTNYLNTSEQSKEKNAAFDLLDALTRSGGLTIDQGASFHLFVGFTHQFDETIMDTLVKKNVNPIVKVEKSAIIMQSVLHNLTFDKLEVSNEILKKIKLN